jgi:predicted RNA polymerase sigma factor
LDYKSAVHGEEKTGILLWSTVSLLTHLLLQMEGQPISILGKAMAMGNLIPTTKHAGITDVCKEQKMLSL